MDVITVRDKRIESKVNKRGNPFQFWDSDGERFIRPASRSDWETSDEKYYIPTGGEQPKIVENEFECPSCETHHIGYPDDCGKCGVSYKWDET